nr:hypothetical protein [Tanacetum cinerariifolium]
LRYISLPNWDHDALLESSSCKPQDDCNTDVLESSGNSNPTATSTNPLADQLETLTVETPILIVSSPVPTTYFTNSKDPSSDTRLISKRVANQVETPSLDTILTLTNRFKDILRVTTNSDESNGVEANVSNMETIITASPTPTLRIYKDHPKSQIIGPVDTPIQTKNKSKESLVDCPKGVRPIGTKWVLKNKKDEKGIVIKNKARLVAQGYTQEEGIDYDEVFAPVVRIEVIRLFLAYASLMGFTVYQMDVKSTFLYDTIDEEVYVMQPPGFQDPEFLARVYKVEKAMYGLHQAPRAWYDDIIFGSINPQLCREFEALMHEKFQMSAVVELNFFLGLQVLQKEDGIFLSQDKHQVTPKECHLHVVKRIFRYLKGHPKLGLWYPKESPFDLIAYSNSDYGGATQDRRSTTGGSASCCGQVLWIQNQLLDYEYNFMNTKIYIDNNSAICIVKSPVYHPKTKHIEIRHHFIKDCFEKKLISVDHIHTDENVADLLTKSFDAGRFQYLVFWSTARIETTEEGTKILAIVDGILRTVTKSSLRRNLKLKDEEGISSLPDAKLFKNLTLIGYNISPNQKFTFQKGRIVPIFDSMLVPQGEDSSTPTEPHHTPSPKAQQTSPTTHSSPTLPPVTTAPIPTVTPSNTPHLRQYTRRARIAQSSALPPVADKTASPLRDVSQGEACPTDSGFEADQDRANIAKTSTLPHESTSRVPSFAADEGSLQLQIQELTDLCTSLQRQQSDLVSKFEAQELEINKLKARVKLLEDRERRVAERFRDDASIKGRNLDEGEAAAERVSDDTEEMATVLTSIDAASILTSGGVQVVPTAAKVATATVSIPAGSDVVPTASPIFATATIVTPYTRRKVLKQIEYFIPMGLKEEAGRFKRKGIRFEQESGKKLKTLEEVKASEEFLEEKVKEMMQLVPIEEVYVEALQVKHPIIDWKVHTEGQRNYWKIIRLGGSSANSIFLWTY